MTLIQPRPIKCDLCKSEMKFKERIPSNKLRIRRFICACGYQKTIFADGYFDEIIIPKISLSDVRKMYKEQNENNQ